MMLWPARLHAKEAAQGYGEAFHGAFEQNGRGAPSRPMRSRISIDGLFKATGFTMFHAERRRFHAEAI